MDLTARAARTAFVAAALTSAAVPAAHAQDAAPTPTPVAPAPPADGRLTVRADGPYEDRGRAVALRGDRVRVRGTLTPFVAGQKAIVRVRDGRRTLVERTVAIRRQGDVGVFSVRPRMRRTGTLSVRASHEGTPELRPLRSRTRRLTVVRPSASYGSRGPLVRIFQRKLRRLRYLSGPVTGTYGDATGRAVMAWRKVNGRRRVYSADSGVVRSVLAGRGAWRVRHPRAGRHVEADISLQALALVDGRRVVRVYPTSSGAPATPTVLGRYRFYRKTPGTNSLGMVHSAYFIRGYAIHGYASVPPYNASHGCLRVPVPDARRIFDWIRLGDRIFVER